MIILTWKIFFIFSYIVVNFLISFYIFRNYKKFRKEKLITDPETNKIIDVHKIYPEFVKHGEVGFLRIFFGLVFLFWIKIFLCLFLAFCLGLWLM
jgi:hypothetical protein